MPEAESFKSCPRVGGILEKQLDAMQKGEVSSRAPVWGASWKNNWTPCKKVRFQVVPPCGGHPTMGCVSTTTRKFQVVPPCGGHLGTVTGKKS